MELSQVTDLGRQIVDEVEQAVIGKRSSLELVLVALLANGHVLLEDVPGLAKTLTARSFAQVTGLEFARVQFTPDLMPSDITGSSVFDPRTADFAFRPGPVFTHLVLADEINRASPKTQAALLEAMQERQVSIDGTTHPLERPFLVVATQNPVEYEGTYPLPEAQLDRFLLRVGFGYPDREAEWEVLSRRIERRHDELTLRAVVDRETLLEMQRTVESVHVERSIGLYMVDLVTATRKHASVQVGASPRGSLALAMAGRAYAVLAGRDYVTPEDVMAVAVPALGHRIVLKPAQWVRGVTGDQVVSEVLGRVPTPAPEDLAVTR
jgi:MoxR-like ATPase